MPRGRPPGSANAVLRLDDGRFSVVVYYRADRASFRIVSGFRGAGQAETSASREDEARAVADTIWVSYQRGRITAPDPAPLTLRDLAEAIATRPKLSPKTLRSYHQVWALFSRHVGESRAPARVYRMDVVDFLDTVSAGTYSPKSGGDSSATVATYYRTLRAGFRWAMSKHWLADDPTTDIEIEHEHELGPWLPYSEWDAYLTECWPMHQVRSGFVLESGLRASEMAFARPEWIRGDVGRRGIWIGPDPVTGWKPKGKPRIVPLTDKAEWWLEQAAKIWPGSAWLFSAEGLSALGNLSRETRDAVERARVTKTNFHGLRRSAGAHWLDCGLSLYEVSRLLGHQDVKTTMRWYADISDTTLVAAIAKVERRREEARHEEAELGGRLYALRRRA